MRIVSVLCGLLAAVMVLLLPVGLIAYALGVSFAEPTAGLFAGILLMMLAVAPAALCVTLWELADDEK